MQSFRISPSSVLTTSKTNTKHHAIAAESNLLSLQIPNFYGGDND